MKVTIISRKIAIITMIIIAIIIFVFSYVCIVKANKEANLVWAKNSKYKILIDVEESKLYVFEEEKLFKTYKCSAGTESNPSPIGKWEIISKRLWGEGFGGRWLGLNVPWGTFGIHGTNRPDKIGFNVSHRLYSYGEQSNYRTLLFDSNAHRSYYYQWCVWSFWKWI